MDAYKGWPWPTTEPGGTALTETIPELTDYENELTDDGNKTGTCAADQLATRDKN